MGVSLLASCCPRGDMEYQRVRLQLDFPSLQRCWFLFSPTKCRSVSDLARLIAKRFDISNNSQLRLYVEGFLLPPRENIQIVRDNDIIRVTADESSTSTSDTSSAGVPLPPPAKRHCTTTRNQSLFSSSSSSSSEESSSTSSSSDSDHAVSKQPSTSRGQNQLSISRGGRKQPSTSRGGRKQLSISRGSQNLSSSTSAGITKPTPPKNKLKRVTTAKSSGGVHIRFQSSSSDSEPPPVVKSKPVQTPSKQVVPEKSRKPASKKRSIVGGANDILEVSSEVLVDGKSVNNKSGKRSGRGRRALINRQMNNSKSDVNREGSDAADEGPAKEAPSEPVNDLVTDARNYSLCPDLHGPPRQGDKIAFKTLELSESYSPVHSDYKEGVVVSCDPDNNSIVIRWTQHTMKKELEKASKQSIGKFALPQDEEQVNDEDSNNQVMIELSSLITPKLIT